MTRPSLASEPRPAPHAAPAASSFVTSLPPSAIDSRALALFDNAALRTQIGKLDKLELTSVWRLTQAVEGERIVLDDLPEAGVVDLDALDREAARGRRVCGLRVPSVLSSSDHHVLIDPRPARGSSAPYRVSGWSRVPFDWLAATAS